MNYKEFKNKIKWIRIWSFGYLVPIVLLSAIIVDTLNKECMSNVWMSLLFISFALELMHFIYAGFWYPMKYVKKGEVNHDMSYARGYVTMVIIPLPIVHYLSAICGLSSCGIVVCYIIFYSISVLLHIQLREKTSTEKLDDYYGLKDLIKEKTP
jgi:hypothetical protein